MDDHQLFREGVVALLSAQNDIEVVGEAADADTALQMIQATSPDVVVLDLLLPGTNGIEIGRAILQKKPQQKLLALTMVRHPQRVAQALEAGFLGYALKDGPARELVAAIHAVAERRQYLAPGLSPVGNGAPHAGDGQLAKLTHREREVFDLTIAGASTEAIARQLFISRRTVETHRARILNKLGAHSALDLVRLAARLGLLDLAS